MKFVHNKGENCVCDLCGKEFKSQYNLKIHLNAVHDRIHLPI